MFAQEFAPNRTVRTAQASSFRFLPSFATIALITLMAGCGSDSPDRVQVFPAVGQLIWDNKPLSGALVVLHPISQVSEEALPSRAQSDSEGKFELTTYDKGDGAPTGEYAVTVEYYPLQKSADGFLAGPNALPSKYSSPKSSDLRIRISEGENRLPPLILKR